MKTFAIRALAIVALSIAAVVPVSAQELKIGYVNSERVLREAIPAKALLLARHKLRVRRLPTDVMGSSMRRLDRHRGEVLLDATLDTASQTFQLALQIAKMSGATIVASRSAKAGGNRCTPRRHAPAEALEL